MTLIIVVSQSSARSLFFNRKKVPIASRRIVFIRFTCSNPEDFDRTVLSGTRLTYK
jgi:hypothetical protein